MQKIKLKGDFSSGRIWLNEKELSLEKSLHVRSHSPTGFAWGYSGSGPAQLALAICIELFTVGRALNIYQQFKEDVISCLPEADFEKEIQLKYYP